MKIFRVIRGNIVDTMHSFYKGICIEHTANAKRENESMHSKSCLMKYDLMNYSFKTKTSTALLEEAVDKLILIKYLFGSKKKNILKSRTNMGRISRE
jgi:hypothetical protein